MPKHFSIWEMCERRKEEMSGKRLQHSINEIYFDVFLLLFVGFYFPRMLFVEIELSREELLEWANNFPMFVFIKFMYFSKINR